MTGQKEIKHWNTSRDEQRDREWVESETQGIGHSADTVDKRKGYSQSITNLRQKREQNTKGIYNSPPFLYSYRL